MVDVNSLYCPKFGQWNQVPTSQQQPPWKSTMKTGTVQNQSVGTVALLGIEVAINSVYTHNFQTTI